jgi:hypothetical protein
MSVFCGAIARFEGLLNDRTGLKALGCTALTRVRFFRALPKGRQSPLGPKADGFAPPNRPLMQVCAVSESGRLVSHDLQIEAVFQIP